MAENYEALLAEYEKLKEEFSDHRSIFHIN